MGLLDNTYEKWRNTLCRTNLVLAIGIFIAEVGMFFFLKASDLIQQPIQDYLINFLLAPTVLNVAIIAFGQMFLYYFSENKVVVNYVPILQLFLLCCVVAITHFVFSVTLCAFVMPILVTVIFGNKRMPYVITALSFLGVGAALFYGRVSVADPAEDEFWLAEGIVAIVVLVSACIVSEVLIRFQAEKTALIEKSYQAQLEMQERLNKDQKTGLYAPNALMNHLKNIVQEEPEDGSVLLAIMDIDDFKRINDVYGHNQGDKVIYHFAQIMKQYCSDEFPARFGGEEFAVVFEGKNVSQVSEILEVIRHDFSMSTYDFTSERITVSIGFAAYRKGMNDQSFFDHADRAMYEAKTTGKNKVFQMKMI